MGKEVGLAVAIVAAAFAGCIQAPEDIEAAAAEALVPPVASLSAWYALETTSGPDADVTAFWWTVPEGAVYKESTFGEYDVTTVELVLENDGKNAALTEWAVLAFVHTDDGLMPGSMYVGTPYVSATGSLIGGEVGEQTPQVAPTYMRIWDAKEGDRVGFVVAARSVEDAPMRVLLRTLDKDPDWRDEATSDAAAFVAARDGAPLPIPIAGASEGLHLAEYVEMNIGFGVPYSMTWYTPTVTIEGDVSPDVRPLAAQRSQTFSTQSDLAGWTMSFAMYVAQNAVGEWSGTLEAHGEEAAGSGPVASAGPFYAPASMLLSTPALTVVAEGEGGSASTFAIDVATTSATGYEVLTLHSLSLGETIQELLGERAFTASHGATSVLRDVRTPALDAANALR